MSPSSPAATRSQQVWLFIVAPIIGAVIAGFSYRALLGEGPTESLEAASAG